MGLLSGRVAVVTGASRGAGRGIALALGDTGATVYVTGRTVRGGSLPFIGAPGTIEDTAEGVTARGGRGIAVRCDHTDDIQSAALFERVAHEQGRLDLLVNNAWGGNEGSFAEVPFWEEPLTNWDCMFTAGVRAHLAASRFAVPVMLKAGCGLIVCTTFYDEGRFIGNLYYDLAKASINRLAFGLACQLRPHGIAAVALSPGFMRTELVLMHPDPQVGEPGESTEYIGRAVAALAADPHILERSGRVLVVGELAREYGLCDIDGSQPPPFRLPPGAHPQPPRR
ncbi:SDR family NAD(P)-dependent oxidoreductase [Gloeobacter violaceus]|uniref:Glr2355 protein n=1 Tax=Gloeobacter violaceus (strain ATCC 29082 / PCC 7421) TaxID=251221 RepID=Q7NI29_GLOVI|nr:SDR family NAD(P)-dependent oxidoreductase [Gloeobacter violaceus]BAC90296.1 glr2355 [Gloeobacter violaceus PCC 7421]